jgi:hypothetical protein
MKRRFLIVGVGLSVLVGTSIAAAILPSTLGTRTVHAAATYRSVAASLAISSSRDMIATQQVTAARQAALQLRRTNGRPLLHRAARLSAADRHHTGTSASRTYGTHYAAMYSTRYRAGSGTAHYMRFYRASAGHTGHNCPGMTSTSTGK